MNDSGEKRSKTKFHKTIIDDFRQSNFRRTLSQDVREIYQFYLDKETREKLAKMGRAKRWLIMQLWLLKSLILKLSTVRRVLLIVALILFITPTHIYRSGNVSFNFNFQILAFLLLLTVLALELKDKLLARDELEVGRAVQFSLMPNKNPVIPGWDIWLYTKPANEVGGDLVDYLQLDEKRWGISLGDVAGKGLGAALLMAKLQSTLRALAQNAASLHNLGTQINTILCRDGLPDRFISLIYLEVKAHSDAINILNAGHLPPIVLRGNTITEMPRGSNALGIMPSSTYEEQRVDLKPDELLVVFSDGVTEARNEKGEFFGDNRLKQSVKQHRSASAEELGKRILAEVDHFINKSRAHDDLSLVVAKRV